MTEASHRDLNAMQIVAMCTLPVVGTLLFVAFGVVERAQVDPSASIFKSDPFWHLPDVWYPALILFGCLHAFGALARRRGDLAKRTLLTFLFLLPFITFNLANVPIALATITGSLLGVALLVTVIGIVFAILVAIALAGAFFGFLLGLPLYFASVPAVHDEPREIAALLKTYVGGGIFAAFVFCAAFGLGSMTSTRAVTVGQSAIDSADILAAWLYIGLAIVLGCAGICFGSTRFWEKNGRPRLRQFAIWFVVPVAAMTALMGPTLKVLAGSSVYRAAAATEPLNSLSLFFREGAPRRSEPVHFKSGEWLMPRERMTLIHLVDGSPFATRLRIRARPEDAVLGEIEVLQKPRRPEDARANRLGTSVCNLDKGRRLLLCQSAGGRAGIQRSRSYFPQSSYVIEIDSENPAREMGYDAFWPQACTVRLSDVGSLGFSAEFQIPCARRFSWRQIAIDVESDLASSYRSGRPSTE